MWHSVAHESTLLRFAAPVLGLALAASAAAAQETRKDDEVHAAWNALEPDERTDVAEWFRAEIEFAQTVQLDLVRHAHEVLGQDPGFLPLAADAPFFDPTEHTPKHIVRRKRLAADDRDAVRERERRFADVPSRRLVPAYRYDFGRGRIERCGDPNDPETIFANALAGLPPGADLAEAVALSVLDDGKERETHFAFGHAYTDRRGRVYPGVTLYDAWCSGATMEMPDVDNLGIVHTVLDEWKKWKPPVSAGSKQRSLYDTVGELFTEARRHRGLREALARTWAIGTPVLRDGYGPSLDALHWAWEDAGGDPTELAGDLPSSRKWSSWIEKARKKAAKKSGVESVQIRRGTLDADAWTVRRTLEWVLTEYGAFDR